MKTREPAADPLELNRWMRRTARAAQCCNNIVRVSDYVTMARRDLINALQDAEKLAPAPRPPGWENATYEQLADYLSTPNELVAMLRRELADAKADFAEVMPMLEELAPLLPPHLRRIKP